MVTKFLWQMRQPFTQPQQVLGAFSQGSHGPSKETHSTDRFLLEAASHPFPQSQEREVKDGSKVSGEAKFKEGLHQLLHRHHPQGAQKH